MSMLLCLVPVAFTEGISNGLGITPPRGWRSWNQFGTNINQDLIEAQYKALVDRSRKVSASPNNSNPNPNLNLNSNL